MNLRSKTMKILCVIGALLMATAHAMEMADEETDLVREVDDMTTEIRRELQSDGMNTNYGTQATSMTKDMEIAVRRWKSTPRKARAQYAELMKPYLKGQFDTLKITRDGYRALRILESEYTRVTNKWIEDKDRLDRDGELEEEIRELREEWETADKTQDALEDLIIECQEKYELIPRSGQEESDDEVDEEFIQNELNRLNALLHYKRPQCFGTMGSRFKSTGTRSRFREHIKNNYCAVCCSDFNKLAGMQDGMQEVEEPDDEALKALIERYGLDEADDMLVEDIMKTRLQCNHHFCEACIQECFKNKPECPMCRQGPGPQETWRRLIFKPTGPNGTGRWVPICFRSYTNPAPLPEGDDGDGAGEMKNNLSESED